MYIMKCVHYKVTYNQIQAGKIHVSELGRKQTNTTKWFPNMSDENMSSEPVVATYGVATSKQCCGDFVCCVPLCCVNNRRLRVYLLVGLVFGPKRPILVSDEADHIV